MLRDILFSSSNCSFVFVISFLASAKTHPSHELVAAAALAGRAARVLLLLLGLHHLLPLDLGRLQPLALLLGLARLLVGLLLAAPYLLLPLLLRQLLLLLGPDLLPLGLLLLEPLQLLLLLAPLLPPLVDVLPQLLVQLALLGFLSRLQEVAISL